MDDRGQFRILILGRLQKIDKRLRYGEFEPEFPISKKNKVVIRECKREK